LTYSDGSGFGHLNLLMTSHLRKRKFASGNHCEIKFMESRTSYQEMTVVGMDQ
jgi:hypothetical protein